jgi:hypothetical protein
MGKKLSISVMSGAACVLSGALASPAHAAHNNNAPFANRGQCQSTLVQLRNDARRAGNTTLLTRLETGVCKRVSEVDLSEADFNDSRAQIDPVADARKFIIDLAF